MKKRPIVEIPRKEIINLMNFHIGKEPAVLKPIHPKNKTNFIRYKKSLENPQVKEFIQSITATKVLKKWVNSYKDMLVFGLAAKSDKNKRLQGWIQFALDEQHRIKQANIQENTKDYLILEVCFARYFGNKLLKQKKGIMSSGLRQAILKMEEIEKLKNTKPRKIIINAYVSQGNEGSVRVLERAGFVKKGKVSYHNPKFKKYQDEEKLLYYKANIKKIRELIK